MVALIFFWSLGVMFFIAGHGLLVKYQAAEVSPLPIKRVFFPWPKKGKILPILCFLMAFILFFFSCQSFMLYVAKLSMLQIILQLFVTAKNSSGVCLILVFTLLAVINVFLLLVLGLKKEQNGIFYDIDSPKIKKLNRITTKSSIPWIAANGIANLLGVKLGGLFFILLFVVILLIVIFYFKERD
jgi:hypothetical protein